MLSIHKYKSLLVLGLVTLGLGLAPNQAKAVTFTPLTSQDATPGFDDADFNLLLNNGDFKELFVAEGRIGNNGTGGNGERELGINRDVAIGGAPVAQGNFTWGNGKLWDFSLEYDGSKVTYKVLDGNQTISLTSQEFSGPVNQIYLRTFARQDNGITNTKNAVSLTNLVFNGTSIGSLASEGTSTSKDVDYLGLSNISSPFTLTGKTALSWLGAAPSRSNLAFQIKVGTSPQSESVPEPGMLGGICLAVTMGAAVSKKKKVAV
ncbi:choice-of-anchor W domain-containing protein [Anabaena lutea]|uniref:PEP-CTERM sorting domain-containing protein n=1 Tax=Anabaena lutea FACHB-196 TaxID=2692881 RepID=A0ABR8FE55_9NOST|nr:choice-of-anchor W domain-containing protein [Anabaena lutea]MBD2568483.1 PEP-CTERM sorting domain-containing protein [Anabaena lutea FACHB-196]